VSYERKDAYYQRAKREGYRSRAAYKLEEIQRRARVLRAGQAVVDLGAWPGGWLQVAGAIVGARGVVVGVDVAEIAPLPLASVKLVHGDVGDPAIVAAIRELLGRPADVVLSDLAPKLSGIAPRDAARAEELAARALAAVDALLRPGGALVMKTFDGAGAEAVRAGVRARFASVRTIGLEATRKGSSERYLVATGFKGTPAAA
jgi:23S rRNA (uridine2552-2'-O)-methyltransferase